MTDAPGKELAIYSPVGEGGELSGLDARLLDIVSKKYPISPEELAKELGVESMTPARCAQRVREIMKSQDWLSLVEQKSLILMDVIKLRDMIYDRIDGGETRITKHGEVVEVEADSAMYGVMVRLLKEWRALIESMRADVNPEKVMIRGAHAKIMLEALSDMFKVYNARLDENGFKVPVALAMEIMEEAMAVGFASLESRTSQ